MARRRVTRTRGNNNGITALFSSGRWREQNEVINDIERERHSYYVREGDGKPAEIRVVERNGAKHLLLLLKHDRARRIPPDRVVAALVAQ